MRIGFVYRRRRALSELSRTRRTGTLPPPQQQQQQQQQVTVME